MKIVKGKIDHSREEVHYKVREGPEVVHYREVTELVLLNGGFTMYSVENLIREELG